MTTDPLRDTWLMFQREHGCSVDRMVCTPTLRDAFLEAARMVCPHDTEEKILWSVMGLRKNKALPRTDR
ncbi:MAG: hypothetical protein WEB58_17030 [Planctomycetaceae bacterium]